LAQLIVIAITATAFRRMSDGAVTNIRNRNGILPSTEKEPA
jgi:hypothetical protein